MRPPVRDLRGALERLPARRRPWLAPLGWLYGLGAALDGRRKAAAALHCEKPVISVGNIEVGGTGKTPFTLALVGLLRALGRRPAVVTGLWGAGTRRELLGDTDPDFGRLAPDEALLLAGRLPDLPLVAARRKWEGARLLDGDPRCDVLVVDDGFQHRRLARDLDLVLLSDGGVPGAGALLPAGPLREFPSALRRADLLLLPEASRAPGGETPVQRFRRRPGRILDGAGGEAAPPAGGLLLASGIARPEGFEAAACARCAELGVSVHGCLRFGDHAPLDDRIAAALKSELARHPGARLLCTEKDARRWASSWSSRVAPEPPLMLELCFELASPAELSALLAEKLS